MSRPRLLDLFCGAGGAGMGYHRAGFDVVGVDLRDQPRYPFTFHKADALTFPLDGFDAIHASPPCQAYSVTRHSHDKQHPELIEPTRDRLKASGLPYVIENVIGAPLSGILLCGTMFNLTTTDEDGRKLWLKRHRLFELGRFFFLTDPCRCDWYGEREGWSCAGVYGGGRSDRAEAKYVRRGGYTPAVKQRRELLGIDWPMQQDRLNQAIPPAYTEFIGGHLLRYLELNTRDAGGGG